MATLTVLPSPVLMPRSPRRNGNGIKRRFRSPSPEVNSNSEQQEVDSRPRKTRKLRERPVAAALAIPAPPHVVQEQPSFNSAVNMEDVEGQATPSISPAAFAEAMDGVLVASNTPNLPIITISPPFIPQNIRAPSSTPSNRSFALGTNDQPDFWFPTGDLVLGVENLMFRVHKRVLAQHSVVFEDMFALSEPSSDCDNVENVPRVQVHDSVADWMETLSWLYTGRPSYEAQSLATVTFSTIKSHLTISNKYDMPALRRLSQFALENMYPTNLVSLFCSPLPGNSSPVLNAPSALILAHQCDVPKVLPAVVYHLLTSHNIDHSTSALHLPLDLRKGYSALQSVATYLCTTLSIPYIMLPPELLPDGPRAFQALLRSEFYRNYCGQPSGSCWDIIQRRWLATLARYTVNRFVNPNLVSSPDRPQVPLLEALRELEGRIGLKNEVSGGHPCENCYWVERRLMRRMIGMVLTALPWWFGL